MDKVKLPVQFSGETPWDAIVNHNGLSIIEEQEFLDFCTRMNISQDASLKTLSRAYATHKTLAEWTKHE